MWSIYTMEFYLVLKKRKSIKFGEKWIELENAVLSEETQARRTNVTCSFPYVHPSLKALDIRA